MMKRRFTICLLLLLGLAAGAQTYFAPVYTDNMVIEQNSRVAIWGSSSPGSEVIIVASWRPTDTLRAQVDGGGHWRAELITPAADHKSHTIQANERLISNIALGEVWLCSGQSNMEWSVDMHSGIKNGQMEAAAATDADIRIMQVPLVSAAYPQQNMNATWKVCTPQTMRTASAIGYFFAKNLRRALDVPVGIISAAWGGSVAEAWTPKWALDKKEGLKGKLLDNSDVWWTGSVGSMYNQMIYPLMPFTLAGVLWYQGESNCNGENTHPEVYQHLMESLIGSWRLGFDQKLPFYMVQIAPFAYAKENGFAATLRQQQVQVAQSVENSGLVVINDLVDDIHNIHPKDKQSVGLRLANYALAEVYGLNMGQYKSPVLDSVSYNKGRIALRFKNADQGLLMRGDNAHGLMIWAEDGVQYPAKVKILGNTIWAWSADVKHPLGVSYCYDNATIGNLFNTSGLPLTPFRTTF